MDWATHLKEKREYNSSQEVKMFGSIKNMDIAPPFWPFDWPHKGTQLFAKHLNELQCNVGYIIMIVLLT